MFNFLKRIKKLEDEISSMWVDQAAIDNILDEDENSDPVALAREQLKGITLNFSGAEGAVEDGLEENEKLDLYSKADQLISNPAFLKIVNHLINVQGNYSVKQAEIMEHVAFGRATINGLSLMREEVERLSNLHRELNKRDEDFDPHSAV